MALKLKQANSKKVAANTVLGKEIEYTFEENAEGNVISVQAYLKNYSNEEYRISAHYDPTNKALMIGISDIDFTDFNPSVYTSIASDILKIIKKEI